MAYEKTTLAVFKKKLKDGKYENVTSAKRALSRAAMPANELDAARAAANKHFGVKAEKPAAKAKSAKKPAAKKAASKKG